MMEMTHKQILDQPNATVSRLNTLLKLDNIRSDARRKAQVIQESPGSNDGTDRLYIRWFEEIADQANRAIDDLNASSTLC